MQRVATHYPPLTLLQLRFDSFGDVVETGEALEFFDDFAVATDEEASGITEQAAELVGDFVVAKDEIADKFGGLLGYPTGFLISRDGKVVKKFQGLTSFDDIAKAIESQL